MLRVLLILVLCFPMLGATKFFGLQEVATATDFNDDFESDTDADWTTGSQCATGWTVATGSITEDIAANSTCEHYTADYLSSDDGRACYADEYPTGNTGFKFRLNATDSNKSYTLRSSTASKLTWRTCAGANCDTIEEVNVGTILAGYCICLQWSGTGASTELNWWIFLTVHCPPTGTTTGANTTTAEWDIDASQSGTMNSGTWSTAPSATTYWGAELDGGASQRYIGVYNGASDEGKIAEIWAWSD